MKQTVQRWKQAAALLAMVTLSVLAASAFAEEAGLDDNRPWIDSALRENVRTVLERPESPK